MRLDRFRRFAIKDTIRTITAINERVESDSVLSLARSLSTRVSVAVTSILSIVMSDYTCLAFRRNHYIMEFKIDFFRTACLLVSFLFSKTHHPLGLPMETLRTRCGVPYYESGAYLSVQPSLRLFDENPVNKKRSPSALFWRARL